MNYRDIIVFDFETGSTNPYKTQPTQIAALALHGRKLTPKGYFNSEIRPILDDDKALELGLDPLQDEALEITNKNRKDLAKAPEPKQVWEKFTSFVNKHNYKKTQWYAPIPAGYNIIGFDMVIVNRMCKEYGPVDKKTGLQALFSKIYKIDVMDNIFMWTENNPDIKSISMDSMREVMELSGDNAHDALQDVKDTANILIKLMKTYRAVSTKIKLEKAFSNGDLYV